MKDRFIVMLRLVSIATFALFLAACSSFSSRMQQLSFGMSPDQVREELGTDYQVVAQSMDANGKAIAGWRYQDSDKDPAYLVYFVNDKLAQWGEAGALKTIPELGEPDGK